LLVSAIDPARGSSIATHSTHYAGRHASVMWSGFENQGPASDEARSLGGLVTVDELDAQPLWLGIHHEGIVRRQTVEGVAT
jgi:hypothetical protein